MKRIEGLSSRKAALHMLDMVLRQDRTLESAAAASGRLPSDDQAFALAIAGETLRRIPDLDRLIDGATRQPLPPDSKARMVLRLALAQVAALRCPDHAVVATALPLVDGGPRRLVHGVLGTLLRKGVGPIEAPRLPDAVEQRWTHAWGEDRVAEARRAIAQRPPLDLSFASEEARDRFVAQTGASSLAPRHARLFDPGPVTALPEFDAGAWWVQDLAASLPARFIPKGVGGVLDCCAAPGGKTMQLAAAGHDIVALDRDRHRVRRLRDNLQRTGLHARVETRDIADYRPDRPFGAILLDAPCSATGTFRRHPEVLYRARAGLIRDLAEQQGRLVDAVSAWLKPGGTLVYSVCSLEPEEGEEVIARALARNPRLRLDDAAIADLPAGLPVPERGQLRILPGMLAAEGGLDGFFIARLVRDRD